MQDPTNRKMSEYSLKKRTSVAAEAQTELRQISHKSFTRIIALCAAITIHNIPEGLVVGVGFGSGDVLTGGTVTIAVALQNFPEGLAVAMPLAASGMAKWKAAL